MQSEVFDVQAMQQNNASIKVSADGFGPAAKHR